MPGQSTTSTAGDFSLGAVVRQLVAKQALTDLQAQEIQSGYAPKLAEIRKKLRTRESENPYAVSYTHLTLPTILLV